MKEVKQGNAEAAKNELSNVLTVSHQLDKYLS